MSASRRPEIALLRELPDFRLLFLATLASSVGTWVAFIALVVDVFDRTEDARWVSALLLVEFLPLILIGLLLGPLIDRLPRKGILVGSDLVRAVIFGVLIVAGSAVHVVLLAGAAGIATSFFRPASYAALPNIVDDERLPPANGLLQSAENLTIALGPLAGGALVAAVGPRPAYAFNAATFVVSALLVLRLRRSLEQERGESGGHWRDVAAGLRLVVGSRPLLTVLVAWSVVMFGNALVNVAEVVIAKVDFESGDLGFGLLVSAAGVGLVAGSLAAGAAIPRAGVRAAYTVAIGLMAVGFALAAVSPNVWVALPCVAVSGVGNGAAVVCNALLVQRGAPDEARGRAFMVLMSIGSALLGLGMVTAGPLTNELGARVTWGVAAALFAAAAAVAAVLLRGRAAEEPVPPGEEPQVAFPTPVTGGETALAPERN